MGSYDGAETCELLGTDILSQLKQIPYCMEIGLYRHDGLAVLDQTPQKVENIKKKSAKGSPVTICASPYTRIEANKKVVNFLDAGNSRPNHREVQALFETINHPPPPHA